MNGDAMVQGENAPAVDLVPAAEVVAAVVRAVREEDLDRPTPCPGTSVAAMLVHLAGLAAAFTAAARHERGRGGDQPRAPHAADLDPDFRDTVPTALVELANAWREPDAWTGMTRVGGVDLPREVAGLVALDELVVHGWDLARATRQPYDAPAAAVEGALGFVGPTVAAAPDGTPGLFGPPVAVAADASPLDRLLGLTGRDPRWR
jgi:uncharacterized protein (TIGR03086 family)